MCALMFLELTAAGNRRLTQNIGNNGYDMIIMAQREQSRGGFDTQRALLPSFATLTGEKLFKDVGMGPLSFTKLVGV